MFVNVSHDQEKADLSSTPVDKMAAMCAASVSTMILVSVSVLMILKTIDEILSQLFAVSCSSLPVHHSSLAASDKSNKLC